MAAGTYIGAASLVLLAALANYFKDFSSIQTRTSLTGQNVIEDSAARNRTRCTFSNSSKAGVAQLTIQRLIRAGTPGYFEEKSGSEPFYALEEQEECWRVLNGRLRIWTESDQSEVELTARSNPFCVAAGDVHTFWNADNVTAVEVETAYIPAGFAEQFYRTKCGLGADAGSIDNISPLQLMVMFSAAKIRLAVVPKSVWLFLQYTLCPVLQYLAGHKPFYPEYAQ